MEKKCVTALMTHEELVIANAIAEYLNGCKSLNTSRVPLVLIHDAQSRNLSVDDWPEPIPNPSWIPPVICARHPALLK